MCLPPRCAHRSYQLDPVTDVCAVVGIWKGVQQQLMNTVRIPAAPIHQCDKDVSHTSRACQDQPWCRIGNAFIHSLQEGTQCSDEFSVDMFVFFLKMITSQLNINKNYISGCKL